MAALPPCDPRFLDRALELAERGRLTVSPNPLVGAVVVRAGTVVGEGFHERAGGPHAEVTALRQAGSAAKGADLYVSLEPCGHFGRTAPCTDAILEAGIARVAFSASDPNPAVSGRGIERLRRRGVRVVRGDSERRAAAEAQNEKFRTWIAKRRPFVLAKWAASLDGRTAAADGRSQWITGPLARERSLLWREEYDAVLVGAGTVVADDPRLNRRLGRNRATPHWRIVLDGRLKVPESARLFDDPEGVLVVTARPESDPKARRLVRRGVAVWSLPGKSGSTCPIRPLLARLAKNEVTSLLVEGGSRTLWEFFATRTVDRVAVFLAPRILAGETAPAGVGGSGFRLAGTPWICDVEVERLGPDLLVEGRIGSDTASR